MDSSVHTAQHARSIDLNIPTRALQDALLAFASAEQIYARTQIAKIRENSKFRRRKHLKMFNVPTTYDSMETCSNQCFCCALDSRKGSCQHKGQKHNVLVVFWSVVRGPAHSNITKNTYLPLPLLHAFISTVTDPNPVS